MDKREKLYSALKDIINAADNGEPYTRDELIEEFGGVLNECGPDPEDTESK